MIIQKVQIDHVIKLSPAWVNLFEFVQKHPYITFERLRFENSEPDFGSVELKITESIKF